MHAIVYISQETQPFSSADLKDLLEFAVARNRANGVTGYLHYESGFFMQYFEGDADAVAALMHRIEADQRHSIFYRADEADIAERRFPDWYMQWEERAPATDQVSVVSELARTLRPFESVNDSDGLDQALKIYHRIAYDHALRAYSKLAGRNDELTHLLLMAVHDLRTPVRAVRGVFDSHIEDAGESVTPELEELSQFVRISLNRMDDLINGVLDHFDSDAKSAPQWVETGAVVDEIAEAVTVSSRSCAVARTEQFPTLRTNPLSFWRVLSSLVTNGLKYNASDCPRVDISAERVGPDWVFSVRDNGIGIDPKYHSEIFRMFRRLHAHSTYPGSGIGLATCHALVQGMRGRIWVESAPGAGSSFHVALPACDQQIEVMAS